MPNFDDLILNITGRVLHQTDFAFAKNSGEMANSLRQTLLAKGLPQPISKIERVEIDDDGDISIRTDKCHLYMSSESILAVGWAVTPNDLSEGRELEGLSRTLELLHKERGSLPLESYQVRLFFSARFLPRSGLLKALQTRSLDTTLTSVLGREAPSEINAFQMSASFNRNPFLDAMELESTGRDLQLRYVREAPADAFDSYRSFMVAANLSTIVQELKPFIEALIAEPSKLLGRVFREKQPK